LAAFLPAVERAVRALARFLDGRDLESMTRAEVDAQEEVREVVGLLKEIRDRLQGIAKGLPAPENAAMLLGEEDPDVATEVRSVIECSLVDQIEPAIRDLTTAASYRPKDRREEM
jgi:hypothetical protein